MVLLEFKPATLPGGPNRFQTTIQPLVGHFDGLSGDQSQPALRRSDLDYSGLTDRCLTNGVARDGDLNFGRHPATAGATPAFVLPCPTNAVLQLCLALAAPSETRQLKIHQLLRINPALLLFAAYEHFRVLGQPVDRPQQLVEWSETYLLECFNRQRWGSGVTNFPPAKLKQRLNKFLRARKRSKCIAALTEWLKQYSRLTKPVGRELLNTIMGPKFRVDNFRATGVRRDTTLASEFQAWGRSSAELPILPAIVGLLAGQSELQRQFHRQLEVEKLAAMKQLAYGASHEINNPLANIATRAQTLLVGEAHPEKRSKLAVIYQQAMRAHEMISDMMLFAHPPATQIHNVSLRQVVRQSINHLDQVRHDHPGIDIRFIVGAGVATVAIDPTQFQVALGALVRNSVEAISAVRDAGEVEVRFDLCRWAESNLRSSTGVAPETWGLLVTVWDSGPGVTPAVRRHLFDPFYSGREAGRGLGFGLSKTWRIVQQHDGQLWHDDRCQTGTRFRFWIPQPGDSADQFDRKLNTSIELTAARETSSQESSSARSQPANAPALRSQVHANSEPA